MYIEIIYEELKEIGGCRSRNDFCTDYLGRDRNYMNVCINKKRDISKDALVTLFSNLNSKAKKWNEIANDRNGAYWVYEEKSKKYSALCSEVKEQLLN